ncbi:hypothetical protein ACFRFH_12125 [Leifsonia sp. NPDC056824]|uniref:hypothetical protein n=1 Tax=Leifsonia sp. NPDC056824 TaxID=3345953 RepID=UPI0036D19596
MKVRNVSPFGDLELPLLNRIVEAGEVFEVPDEHGESLIQQSANFQKVPANTKTKDGGESK